ncbi:SMP-30/gluconolactonase/LRE family protein [Lacisediminimonas profundi]|uniref:SMP-30/gluconolactonase/LRE family protein n=1 Tax=Lacisediminimonas profundi TaxID=2603856 RepID=UPI00124B4124|nr:SMP-30/gluconolactonase/LRE family protein [Lacisediminimonas profundi]
MNMVHVFYDEPMLLGECPLWEPREGALYWIDIEGRAVHRYIEKQRQHTAWSLPSEPGCIARAESGLVVAMRTGIATLDTLSGYLRQVTPAPFDGATQRFNDGRCDPMGRLWVGTINEPRDGPKATLFCLEGGQLRDAGLPVTVSNGLAFSPDSRTLYHADTSAHLIKAYDYQLSTGQVGPGRILRQFDTARDENYGGRPDGAAVDSEGAYWIAMYEGGRILRLSPAGAILGEFPLPVRCPTMIAFGGEDMRTLFITTVSFKRPAEELRNNPLSGKVLQMRVDVPGRIENLCRI